jgi:hypothetical protein
MNGANDQAGRQKNGDPKIAVTKRQMILKNQDYLYTLT